MHIPEELLPIPLLFILCLLSYQSPIKAQCFGATQETAYNITLFGYPQLGQSWLSDCRGSLRTITVRSNRVTPISNVTLRIWQQDIPVLGSQSVVYIKTEYSLNAQNQTTTFSLPFPYLLLEPSKVYYFTLTAENGENLELQAQNLGTYVGGYAVNGSLQQIGAYQILI